MQQKGEDCPALAEPSLSLSTPQLQPPLNRIRREGRLVCGAPASIEHEADYYSAVASAKLCILLQDLGHAPKYSKESLLISLKLFDMERNEDHDLQGTPVRTGKANGNETRTVVDRILLDLSLTELLESEDVCPDAGLSGSLKPRGR